MAYSDIFAAATDAAHGLRKQVTVAMYRQALATLVEDAGTANHAQRIYLAQWVLRDPVAAAAFAIWRVMANRTIADFPTAASDELVQSVVGNSWDALSKVYF